MGIRVTRRALSLSAAYRELDHPGAGGIVLFVGRVRPDRTQAGRVEALLYESDKPMALPRLARLAAEAKRRFHARRLVLHHRVGRLGVGTISVVVGASASHRDDAFRAARYLIEELKASVPIWKTDILERRRR